MEHYKYLVVGGGMTADAAVRGVRERDTRSLKASGRGRTWRAYGAKLPK
jgi:hypothetical protein